jgi:hypothetical protein
MRVRIRTPAGPAATTGSAILRSGTPSAIDHILTADTDNNAPTPTAQLTSRGITHFGALPSQQLTTPTPGAPRRDDLSDVGLAFAAALERTQGFRKYFAKIRQAVCRNVSAVGSSGLPGV